MRATAAAGGLLIGVALAGGLAPGRARACSFAGPTPHTIDPALVGVDQTPPNLPQPTVLTINRHDGTGCRSGDSCGDFVSVEIANLASDDLTPADKIGYRLTVVAGSGFTPPSGDVRTGNAGDRFWLLLDGFPDDIDFTLQMIAIDAAGNESAPQTMRVHEDTGMCSVGRGERGGVLAFAIVALVMAAAARRRRGRRGAMGALVVFVAAAVISPSPARACSPLQGPLPYVADPAMVGVDEVPPVLSQPEVVAITRSDDDGCTMSKCANPSTVIIYTPATDDTTAVDAIGFRFAVVAGALPGGLALPANTVRATTSGGSFSFHFSTGYDDDIDFTLQVIAVDAAGNESAPQNVRVHEDVGACSVGRRDRTGGLTLAIVVLAVGVAARRSQRQRA